MVALGEARLQNALSSKSLRELLVDGLDSLARGDEGSGPQPKAFILPGGLTVIVPDDLATRVREIAASVGRTEAETVSIAICRGVGRAGGA